MSYSGGFGRAPRHHVPRRNEHGARRSHANMERQITQYEEESPQKESLVPTIRARSIPTPHTDTTESKRIIAAFLTSMTSIAINST